MQSNFSFSRTTLFLRCVAIANLLLMMHHLAWAEVVFLSQLESNEYSIAPYAEVIVAPNIITIRRRVEKNIVKLPEPEPIPMDHLQYNDEYYKILFMIYSIFLFLHFSILLIDGYKVNTSKLFILSASLFIAMFYGILLAVQYKIPSIYGVPLIIVWSIIISIFLLKSKLDTSKFILNTFSNALISTSVNIVISKFVGNNYGMLTLFPKIAQYSSSTRILFLHMYIIMFSLILYTIQQKIQKKAEKKISMNWKFITVTVSTFLWISSLSYILAIILNIKDIPIDAINFFSYPDEINFRNYLHIIYMISWPLLSAFWYQDKNKEYHEFLDM